MNWEQIVAGALLGLPAFVWRWIDRMDAKSEMAQKKADAEKTVETLTRAVKQKNSELQKMKDEMNYREERDQREKESLRRRVHHLEDLMGRVTSDRDQARRTME